MYLEYWDFSKPDWKITSGDYLGGPTKKPTINFETNPAGFTFESDRLVWNDGYYIYATMPSMAANKFIIETRIGRYQKNSSATWDTLIGLCNPSGTWHEYISFWPKESVRQVMAINDDMFGGDYSKTYDWMAKVHDIRIEVDRLKVKSVYYIDGTKIASRDSVTPYNSITIGMASNGTNKGWIEYLKIFEEDGDLLTYASAIENKGDLYGWKKQ